MTPTTRLRFVEREITVPLADYRHNGGYLIAEHKKVRILQQWWEDPNTVAYTGDRRDLIPKGEWIDVPIEVEK